MVKCVSHAIPNPTDSQKKHRRDQILPVSAFTTSKGIVSEIAVS